ncbi:SpoIIE family protein phosphatase [Actinocorallia longicatena]|uniref:PAS domain-containing protein n=1 Tax=Actinocorallia longicatena TaxID=111803 RepID=A0ABP6Q0H8_9ACTN
MPEPSAQDSVLREIIELETRIGELRQAAAVPATDLKATLDAALLELDLALTSLRLLGGGRATGDGGVASDEERRVLRTLFQAAPVPLFLLDREGDVRRVNAQAAQLLGTSSGYVAGRPFSVFCDLKTRAALRSQLAAVVRTGERAEVEVRFLSGKKPVDAVVTLVSAEAKDGMDALVVAAALPKGGKLPVPGYTEEGDAAVAAVLHRMDVLAMATELLLDEPVFNEAVAVRRCARLLANELADWAFVDVLDGTELRRQVAFGPPADRPVAHLVEGLEPGPVAREVHQSRQSTLHPHVEDLSLLGKTAEGISVCAMLGATSVLCVPIEDGQNCLGVITLASGADSGYFDLTDLGVVQRVARHLALVIRAARMYRRSAEVNQALQTSLLPRALPEVPGARVAAKYVAATRGVEVGGDFYDVFKAKDGWGLVLGDVCGKGEEAAAVTAAARHGIRQLGRWKAEPGEVLSMINETLLEEERYVTGVYAVLTEANELRVATAGHPPIIVIKADGMVRTTEGGGVPLGLFEDFEPAAESVLLEEGDTLLLHSDGVLDACDDMRQRFGEERLMEVLAGQATAPLPELLAAIERALLDFCGDDMGDDVSMLALRVLPQTLD